MKAKKPTQKTTRKRYSDEFKDQALKRAERDGVALVAQDLGIAETQIYAWRRKRQIEGAVTETERLKEAEVARLKRDLARLEEVSTATKLSPFRQGKMSPIRPLSPALRSRSWASSREAPPCVSLSVDSFLL